MAGLSSHAVFRVVTTAAAACAMSCLGGKRLSMPYEMHGDMVESEKNGFKYLFDMCFMYIFAISK